MIIINDGSVRVRVSECRSVPAESHRADNTPLLRAAAARCLGRYCLLSAVTALLTFQLRCPSTCSTQISITSTGLLFGTFKKALQSLIIQNKTEICIHYLSTYTCILQYALYHTYLISTIKICIDQSTIS